MERRLVRLGGTAALLSESSGEESPLPLRPSTASPASSSILPNQSSYTRGISSQMQFI